MISSVIHNSLIFGCKINYFCINFQIFLLFYAIFSHFFAFSAHNSKNFSTFANGNFRTNPTQSGVLLTEGHQV